MNAHSAVSPVQQTNKQMNKQTNMNARSFSEAKWQMARALLFIYLSTTTTYLSSLFVFF